jgi:hypothetical protein
MIKQTITFDDLDGNKVTEDFYFHFSKIELAEMSMSIPGGMKSYLEQIVNAQEGGQIIAAFRDIIAKSVGRRGADNRQFEKSTAISDAFMQSNAFEEFFFSLISDEGKAAEFVNGLMPASLMREIENVELPGPREFTEQELLDMSEADFQIVAGTNERDWSREHLLIGMKRRSRQNRQPA